MKTFREMAINETVINLFKKEDKLKYVDEVWNLLNKAYETIGGIKGSGFSSKKDMINKIKMWKLFRKNGNIIAGLMYKDKDMRKTVAVFTDASKEGKKELENMLRADFERSSIEVSHSLMAFIEKKMPSLVKKYAVQTSKVSDILGKPIEIIDKYHYKRDINGTVINKMMLGNIKKFYEV